MLWSFKPCIRKYLSTKIRGLGVIYGRKNWHLEIFGVPFCFVLPQAQYIDSLHVKTTKQYSPFFIVLNSCFSYHYPQFISDWGLCCGSVAQARQEESQAPSCSEGYKQVIQYIGHIVHQQGHTVHQQVIQYTNRSYSTIKKYILGQCHNKMYVFQYVFL